MLDLFDVRLIVVCITAFLLACVVTVASLYKAQLRSEERIACYQHAEQTALCTYSME